MKSMFFAAVLLLSAFEVSYADVEWDFEGCSQSTGCDPPAGWAGYGFQIRNLHNNGGYLTNRLPGTNEVALGVVDSPTFMFVGGPAATLSDSHDSQSGMGSGGTAVTTNIAIDHFVCSPKGSLANCIVSLYRVDTGEQFKKVLSTGPYNGRIDVTIPSEEEVVHSDGIYTVRFRTQDNNDPDTGMDASNLRVSNAVVVAPNAGDYNLDGVVDAADYVVWRDNLGDVVPACSIADGNCSGFVDNSDFEIWKSRFGSLVGSGASAILPAPEPDGIVAIAVCTLFTSIRVRLSRRHTVGQTVLKLAGKTRSNWRR